MNLKRDSIFKAVGKIFSPSKFFFLSPLRQDILGFGTSKVRFSIALLNIILTYVVTQVNYYYYEQTSVVQFFFFLMCISFSQMLIILCDVLVMFLSDDKLNYILFELNQADLILNNLGILPKNKSFLKHFYIYLFFALFMFSLDKLFNPYESNAPTPALYLFILVHTVEFKYISFLVLLKEKLSSLCLALRISSQRIPVSAKEVHDLADTVVKLSVVSRRMNELFSLQSVFMFALYFGSITMTLFWVIATDWSTIFRMSIFSLTFSRLYWGSATLTTALRLTVTVSGIKNKEREFRTVLFEIIQKDEWSDLHKDVKIKIFMTQKLDFNFTAYRAFPIDKTALQAMLAASATYLVILLQFGAAGARRMYHV